MNVNEALQLALRTNILDAAGPFFLGFTFEALGMGVVLVLSINYFVAIASRTKAPAESSRRLGVILVALSLCINLAQTTTDIYRGWAMFVKHFMDLAGLLAPTPLFFVSPFLGLFPAVITQLFLLRRTIKFISSLSDFWPRLAHPRVRWVFGLVMSLAILSCCVTGTWASEMVWRAEHLWLLARGSSGKESRFPAIQMIWLVTSAAVDVILSTVLCIELWWARRQLAAKGGVMRDIVMKLMLITFNGGLAVTAMQLSALFLYQFSTRTAWCYFPMLSLPKVYTVTLILSLSLPHEKGGGPTPSHIFSLPTIHAQTGTHTPPSSRPASPSVSAGTPATEKEMPQGARRKGWRRSHRWLGFSLGGAGEREIIKDEKPSRHIWSRPEDIDLQPLPERRRSSVAPLLAPPTPRIANASFAPETPSTASNVWPSPPPPVFLVHPADIHRRQSLPPFLDPPTHLILDIPLFGTLDPLSSPEPFSPYPQTPSTASQPLRPPLSPLQQPSNDDDGDDGDDGDPGHQSGDGQMLSFQDMLASPALPQSPK